LFAVTPKRCVVLSARCRFLPSRTNFSPVKLSRIEFLTCVEAYLPRLAGQQRTRRNPVAITPLGADPF
jgi:hypothetical protein